MCEEPNVFSTEGEDVNVYIRNIEPEDIKKGKIEIESPETISIYPLQKGQLDNTEWCGIGIWINERKGNFIELFIPKRILKLLSKSPKPDDTDNADKTDIKPKLIDLLELWHVDYLGEYKAEFGIDYYYDKLADAIITLMTDAPKENNICLTCGKQTNCPYDKPRSKCNSWIETRRTFTPKDGDSE